MAAYTGLKEAVGGGIGAAVGGLAVIISGKFGVEWSADEAIILTLALQALWGGIRQYLPTKAGGLPTN